MLPFWSGLPLPSSKAWLTKTSILTSAARADRPTPKKIEAANAMQRIVVWAFVICEYVTPGLLRIPGTILTVYLHITFRTHVDRTPLTQESFKPAPLRTYTRQTIPYHPMSQLVIALDFYQEHT
jgi:hypothetical protein